MAHAKIHGETDVPSIPTMLGDRNARGRSKKPGLLARNSIPGRLDPPSQNMYMCTKRGPRIGSDDLTTEQAGQMHTSLFWLANYLSRVVKRMERTGFPHE